MSDVAKIYGVEFDKDKPVHGGSHDKYLVGNYSVEVPRHSEISEYTARGVLRTFEQICLLACKEDR
jgi:hypothetical protein